MSRGWRYRLVSVLGVGGLVSGLLLLANSAALQTFVTAYVPPFTRLEPTVLTGGRLWTAVGLSVLVIGASLLPLYKPQPSRVLDTIVYAQKRVVVGGFALAALGYFEWSSRLPRTTLALTVAGALLTVPLWFVWLRRRPSTAAGRTLIVGDDRAQMRQIVPVIDAPIAGYLCPSRSSGDGQRADGGLAVAEEAGGSEYGTASGREGPTNDLAGVARLGGLSRLEDILVEYDIDTVILSFERADRSEFFGTLDACYEHGVAARVHRDYGDSVLTADGSVGTFVDIEIEPWDVQDRIIKRAFDIAFAGVALLVCLPVIVAIVVAIKFESEWPILFSQERTSLFGDTFTVHKFRTLKPEPGGEVGTSFNGDRETPLGNFLRTTHLDEIPQLWSILVGDMSVVGPRPAQTALEDDFQAKAEQWQQRWFVKPGLTGLAQINDATSSEPREKIQYDLQYIRSQSFTFDLKILIRQLWSVFEDVVAIVMRR